VRQRVAESLLVSIAAGAAGVALAAAILPLLVRLIPPEYMTADPDLVRVNGSIAALAAALSIATGVVFGLIPALRSSASHAGSLRHRGSAADRRTRWFQYTLSTVQIALTLLVAVSAILTIEGYRAAERLALGFNPDGVISGYVSLPATSYANADSIAAFYRAALAALIEQPGVSGAAAITDRPLGYRAVDMSAFEVRLPGHPPRDGASPPSSVFRIVSPTYFAVMQTPIVAGRAFTDADGIGAGLVTIANQAFVARFLDGSPPVGQQVVLGTRYGARNLAGAPTPESTVTIVGVAADSRQTRVIDAEVRPELYLPLAQHPAEARAMALIIRSSLDDAAAVKAIRVALRQADPQQPIFGVERMPDVVMRAFGARKVTMVLLFFFAAVSTLLAAVGLYAVINFGVQQRAHEIGVRIAVGASAAAIVRMIVTTGVRLAAAGIVVGAVVAGVAARVLASGLGPVAAIDPRALGVAAGALLAVATLAAWIPARRAARVDPLAALHTDA
jgi:predicted permease